MAVLFTFIGAQMLKGTDEKFNRSIVFERILICLCPIAFVWAMLPYNHFWTVFGSRENIESSFSSSIEKSKQMFENYDRYSTARIASYDSLLQSAIVNKETNADTYVKTGFNGVDDVTMKQIFIETLKLQLQSQNTDSLKNSAIKWIDDANYGATVWNAFLIGNIDEISNAIDGWNKVLIDVSRPVLSNELSYTKPFDADKSSNEAVKSELKQLQRMYTQSSGVSLNTIWTGVILFVMLMFPYLLQKRNTRATGLYSLLPTSFRQRTISKDSKHGDVIHQNTDTSSDTDIYGGTF